MKKDFIFSVSTILFSAFFLIVSLLTPVRSSTFIGSNQWPNMVLAFTLVLGVFKLIKTIKQYRYDNNKKEHYQKENIEENIEVLSRNRHWIILSILALYTLLLPYTGFIISTTVLIGFLFSLLGIRKKGVIILLSLASNAFFIVLFAIGLNITLPRGIGIFETFSFIFY